jgi:hypothetical protein
MNSNISMLEKTGGRVMVLQELAAMVFMVI